MQNFLTKIFLKGKSAFLSLLTHFEKRPFESFFFTPLFLFFSWYILTLIGIFTLPLVLITFIGVCLAIGFIFIKKPRCCSPSSILLVIFLFFFATLAFLTHPPEPVAEGRDQGTFLNSALLVKENKSFFFSLPESEYFFALYGPGKALHFPGLAYTENGLLRPEFPLGYITWLAGFITLFGLSGILVANGASYLLSGLLFNTLLRRATSTSLAFFLTLLFMGSFLPLWFLSFTLTENLALFLFLLVCESVIRFKITKDKTTLLLALASAFALALTRIEGWAILALTLYVAASSKSWREWISVYILKNRLLLLISIFFALPIAIFTFSINSPYYIAILKALLKTADRSIAAESITEQAFPLYTLLWQYGLLPIFLLGLVSALVLWKKKRIHFLIPFFLALPTVPYLLLPHITFDAPWMLRRFLFTLYPALFLSLCFAFAITLARYNPKRQFIGWILFFALVIGIQIPAWHHYSTTRYQNTLLPQLQTLSASFTSNDLLLVDRDVTGDNFMMPARILSLFFGIPSVYFFNTQDFKEIEKIGSSNVYLLVPTEKIPIYNSSFGITLVPTATFVFINDHSFRRSKDGESLTLPTKQVITTEISIIKLR